MSGLREILQRFIDPLKRRVYLMIARGVVKNVDDSKLLQHVQVSLLQGEIRNDVERFQQYGFSSFPQVGAEAICLFLNGNRDHGIVIAVEDRQYRLVGMAQGEVALYTDEGDYIHFKRGNEIEIQTETLTINADTKVEINSPTVEINSETEFSVNTTLLGSDITVNPTQITTNTTDMDLNCKTSFDLNKV